MHYRSGIIIIAMTAIRRMNPEISQTRCIFVQPPLKCLYAFNPQNSSISARKNIISFAAPAALSAAVRAEMKFMILLHGLSCVIQKSACEDDILCTS